MSESRQVRRARERAESKLVQSAVKRAGLNTKEIHLLHEAISIPEVKTKVEPKTLSEKFYALAYEFTEEEIAAKVEKDMQNLNPSRYRNDHEDQHKGQVFGGECNRTACETHGAEFWNMGTYALYCVECARGINYRPQSQLCIRVEEKPAVETHEQLKRDNGYYKMEY